MAEVTEVNDQTFESEVLQAGKPAIVDFWAEWCAPCRAITPIIKELAAEYGDRVVVAKVNADENPGTAGKFGIRSLPTVLAIKDGQVVDQMIGARPRGDFEKFIQKLL